MGEKVLVVTAAALTLLAVCRKELVQSRNSEPPQGRYNIAAAHPNPLSVGVIYGERGGAVTISTRGEMRSNL